MTEVDKPKIGKQEMKRMTRELLRAKFGEEGFEVLERSAGVTTYHAVKNNLDTQYVVASIYGDRRGAASVWVKDDTLELLKESGAVSADEDRNITDISFFKRGQSWKIEIHDTMDPIIDKLVEASRTVANAIQEEEDHLVEQRRLKAEAAKAKADEMASKRKSPF